MFEGVKPKTGRMRNMNGNHAIAKRSERYGSYNARSGYNFWRKSL